ncbi:MAG: hypothetical protein JSW59_01770, partial [Phycisphaerales bacterium]
MCRRNILICELLVILFLGGTVAHAGSDIFSVNFYYYPWAWSQDQYHMITLDENNADQPAGLGEWLTNGWQDIEVPWAPTDPQDPVTITSIQGSEATFTLVDARNGWARNVDNPPVGDGTEEMMNAQCFGTGDDDGANPARIDLVVSDIPFAVYDVILYLGRHLDAGIGGDGTGKLVFNGAEQDITLMEGPFDGTFTEIVDATTPGNYILYEGVMDSSFTVQMWGNGFNHLGICGFQFRQANPELASIPDPADEMTDVPRDGVVLSWRPGEFAAQHDIYLDTDFDNVNDATTTSAAYQGRQAATTFKPGRMEFDTTYYWRIDEVNAPPDSTIFKGQVWSFTTEPVAYPIAGENITATASSSNNPDLGPENTINGFGLDADDLHSDDDKHMWLSGWGGPQPTWVQYEFDKVYKLHEMWVWNHNTPFELAVGFG